MLSIPESGGYPGQEEESVRAAGARGSSQSTVSTATPCVSSAGLSTNPANRAGADAARAHILPPSRPQCSIDIAAATSKGVRSVRSQGGDPLGRRPLLIPGREVPRWPMGGDLYSGSEGDSIPREHPRFAMTTRSRASDPSAVKAGHPWNAGRRPLLLPGREMLSWSSSGRSRTLGSHQPPHGRRERRRAS